MGKARVVHVGPCDNFLPGYIEFLKKHFEFDEHFFLLDSNIGDSTLIKSDNVVLSERTKISRLLHFFRFLRHAFYAEKIILHGLNDIRMVQLLFLCPWLLPKCYWVIWGWDLYVYKLGDETKAWQLEEFFRRSVIKRVKGLVTYVPGDVNYARKWYGASGKYYECLSYTSNLYKKHGGEKSNHGTLSIQVGNSGDPSNNHLEVFDYLRAYKDADISIFVPLSLGERKYTELVAKKGYEIFGDKFKPLFDFIPHQEYLDMLSMIDIAVFNHERQQGMGNIITLLGMGKKIYLRKTVTPWDMFSGLNIKIFDVKEIDLELLSESDQKNNIKILKNYFSEENLIKQLKALFD